MFLSGTVKAVESLQINKSKARFEFARLRDEFVESKCSVLQMIHFNVGRLLRRIILQLPEGTTIASYKERGSEVPTNGFESISSKVHWVYPRVQGTQLQFLKPNKGFVKSPWGVDEPTEDSQRVSLDEIDMVLVPGVAFDRRGHRLGTGQGFYDRALAAYKGVKVGIAYALQVSSNDFAMETHDLPMEYIVTENYMLKQLKGL